MHLLLHDGLLGQRSRLDGSVKNFLGCMECRARLPGRRYSALTLCKEHGMGHLWLISMHLMLLALY